MGPVRPYCAFTGCRDHATGQVIRVDDGEPGQARHMCDRHATFLIHHLGCQPVTTIPTGGLL